MTPVHQQHRFGHRHRQHRVRTRNRFRQLPCPNRPCSLDGLGLLRGSVHSHPNRSTGQCARIPFGRVKPSWLGQELRFRNPRPP